MRFLSRARRNPKLPQRSRLGRRMRRRLVLAGLAVLLIAGLAVGGVRIVRSGIIDRTADAVGWRFAAIAAHAGFAVDKVDVVGRGRTKRAAILAALDVQRGTPILSVDLGEAKTRLEALTWVERVEVERRLPDTIFVRLIERQPLAYWQRNGKLYLIDRHGNVVPTDRVDSFGALIVFVGNDAPKKAADLLAILASEPALYPHVAAAVRVGGRRWNLKLDNGIDIELPENDPAGAWHRLAALDRTKQVLERQIVTVDMRLPDRLVLRLPPPPPKHAPAHKVKGGKST